MCMSDPPVNARSVHYENSIDGTGYSDLSIVSAQLIEYPIPSALVTLSNR